MSAGIIRGIVEIVILVVVAVLVFFVAKNRKENHLTTLAWLAFALVMLGIITITRKIIGYPLIGIGVLLAIINAFLKPKA